MRLRDLILNQSGPEIVDTLPADDTTKGPVVLYYKHPVVSVLPTPVVNGQSWVLDGDPDVEYKGVGGVWVAQSSITYALWMWRMTGKFDPDGQTVSKDSVRLNMAFDANQNYKLQMCGVANNDPSVGFNGLFCSSLDGTIPTRGLWLERENLTKNLLVRLNYPSGGLLSVTVNEFFTGSFFTLEVENINKIHTVKFNGVVIGTMNSTAVTINTNGTNIQVGSQFNGARCLNGFLCKCKLEGNVSFDYDFDAGAGTTIIDKSGNGNNAILTDSTPATFWTRNWVPQP